MTVGTLLTRVARQVDLRLPSLVTVFGISLVAGAVEDEMAPFRSVIYFMALFLIYHGSVNSGAVQGTFMASGFLSLIVVASIFRPQDKVASFHAELPADIFLFLGLAWLPGFVVMLYEGGLEDLKQRRAEQDARVRIQRGRVKEEAKKRKAVQESAEADEAQDKRRASGLSELMRNGLDAADALEVLAILGRALSTGTQAEGMAIFGADPMSSGYNVLETMPEDGIATGPAGDPGAIAQVVREARPLVWSNGSLSGAPANLVVPLLNRGSPIGLVALQLPASRDPEVELRYVTAILPIAQGLLARVLR